jgi:UDP-GlcNAc:undecaprenyl-phosphate/decaprenyl-phosphate GlcNAc-1-phosphate transferase
MGSFETFLQTDATVFLGTFVLSAALVALTIRICRRWGWVAQPRADRWHRGTPSLFGGVPIWLASLGASLIVVPFADGIIWKLLAASTVIFLLGMADDILHLRPRTKLAGQVLVAFLIVDSGIVYPLQQNATINFAISMIWIVGITNAFNLLDNMDGLTAGVALISAIYLAFFYVAVGARDYNLIAIVAAGASAGFLLFNSNPARIFMGDCGSLFLGFLLGTLSLLEVTHVSGLPALVLAPVVVLAVPVFDTLFVSVTRRLRGQAVSQGGTDHSSHRLVQLGLNERRAVLVLASLSVISGAVALAARHIFYSHAVGLIGFWFLFLLLFGIYLFRAETIAPAEGHTANPLWQRILSRDALAFFLDPVALSLSYYLASCLRFRVSLPGAEMQLFLRTWPLVLAVKFACLWGCRVYRRSWWRGSIADSYCLARATLAGEASTVLLLIAMYRFAGFSRVVFMLDAIFSWALLLGIRQSFFLFRGSLDRWSRSDGRQRRVFLLGTSDQTALALSYLRSQRIACAGLIDTNGGADVGRWVWGAQVIGRVDDLPQLANQHEVSEIVLPAAEPLPCPDTEFRAYCGRAYLRLLKLGLYPTEEQLNARNEEKQNPPVVESLDLRRR